jgi:4-amino-4-deoxy-L-arabinose transferase-like glycosyltransferase
MRAVRSRAVLLAIVVAIGAVANFTNVVTHRPATPLMVDSDSYLVPARNFVAGRGFLGKGDAATFATFAEYPNKEQAETIRPPGYLLLLGTVFAVHGTIDDVILVQRLLNIAIAAALFLFASSVTRSRMIAFAAAAMYAISPPGIWVASTILSDTLGTALILATIVMTYHAIRRDSVALAALAGLIGSAAALTRPIAMYFAVVLALVVVLRARRKAALAIAFVIASIVLPGAWIARNRVEAGAATFSASDAENLLCQWGAGIEVTLDDTHFYRLTALQQQLGFRTRLSHIQKPLFLRAMSLARRDGLDPVSLTVAQRARYLRILGWRIIRAHPLSLLELMFSGVIEMHFIAPAMLAMRFGIGPPAALVLFTPLAVVAFLAMLVGIRELYQRDPTVALLAAGTILYFTAVSTIPQTDLRYVLPFAPMYSVALATGVARARRAAKRGPSYTKPV